MAERCSQLNPKSRRKPETLFKHNLFKTHTLRTKKNPKRFRVHVPYRDS